MPPSNNHSANPQEEGSSVQRQDTSQALHHRQIEGSTVGFDGGTVKSGSVSTTFSLPLSWHKLHYSAGKKRILEGLTGTALPSRCLAIMGSSGAGKTTFLNAVCDRLASGGPLKLKGRRQLGDVEYQRHYRKALGFVTQDDIISPLATPADSLWFSLRARRGTSRAETHVRVEEVLNVLRLTHCRNTQVGIPGLVAGLSGGERKRCNIGIELICDPKVLLLDEPTSGLDSVTSAKVVHLLKQLSRSGRTIIYTIHQPTAEVLSYFDDLMLMTMGRCAFHGTMAASIEYFESIGFKCPDHFTPSDYYMVLMQDTVTSKVLIKRWSKFLKNGPRTIHTAAVRLAKSEADSSTTRFLNGYIKKFSSSLWIQLYEVTQRSFVQITRDYLYIFALASQALFFAIIVGLIFIHMRDDVGGVQDREGMLFMAVMNRSMGPCFVMINNFHNIRAVYTREQQAGAYSPLTFFVGRSVAQFPISIIFIMMECLILYFMVGLHYSAGAFFYYFGVIALVSEVATGLGFAISATFESLVVASGLAPLILLPLSIAGGLFASTDRLRPYWYWIEKPSFMRQGYILVMRNEFQYITDIRCNYFEKGDLYCLNQPHDGNDVLQSLGFLGDPQSATVYMWVSLAILWFLFRFISIMSLTVAARAKT